MLWSSIHIHCTHIFNYSFTHLFALSFVVLWQYENYYDHCYSPNHDSVTWSLDYDKTSDFDDVSGHWHVEEHPKKPGHSRVFYACDLKFKNSLPGPIMNFLQKTALKQATGWVKKESEGNPAAEIPQEFAPAFGF